MEERSHGQGFDERIISDTADQIPTLLDLINLLWIRTHRRCGPSVAKVYEEVWTMVLSFK
ncbi:hypothetical protein [Hyalangium sp.]|uniref:hypothetical protein n=1 Tax=Hyalangium sp. TaxID=2028555 RepID=UPI002D7415C4|nr:hypothetical protein [Hyalangium sp.]HYI02910.1 hypothetical protein [Hyalangium sp.]